MLKQVQHDSFWIASSGFALLTMTNAHAAEVPHWQIIPEKSSVEFSVQASGSEITGRFTRFDADIIFDAENLAESSIKGTVDITSLESDDKDALQTLQGADWLAPKQYPTSTFASRRIESFMGDKFIARGSLNIRGQQVPMALPFSLKIEDNNAVADGEFTIKRQMFAVGAGNTMAADDVTVKVHIEAKK